MHALCKVTVYVGSKLNEGCLLELGHKQGFLLRVLIFPDQLLADVIVELKKPEAPATKLS